MEVYLQVRGAVMVEGMNTREASRKFGLHKDTVLNMLACSVPPGYRLQTPARGPKLDPFTAVIDRIVGVIPGAEISVPFPYEATGCLTSTTFAGIPSIILAGSPPVPDPSAEPLQCGSWGRRIPG